MTMLGHTRALLFWAALLSLATKPVLASLYPTYPIADTTWSGGREEYVKWVDDGSSPTLNDTGRLDIELYLNNKASALLICFLIVNADELSCEQDHVATLAKNVSPESKFHKFKVLPSWGPDSHN